MLVGFRVFGAKLVATQVHFGADSTNPACIGIDHAATDGNAGGQAQIAGSFLAQGSNFLAGASVFAVLNSV